MVQNSLKQRNQVLDHKKSPGQKKPIKKIKRSSSFEHTPRNNNNLLQELLNSNDKEANDDNQEDDTEPK